MKDVILHIFAIGIAISVGMAFRALPGLALWVCALMTLAAYVLLLLGAAFVLWARTEHKYHRLEIPPESGQRVRSSISAAENLGALIPKSARSGRAARGTTKRIMAFLAGGGLSAAFGTFTRVQFIRIRPMYRSTSSHRHGCCRNMLTIAMIRPVIIRWSRPAMTHGA